MHWRDSQPYQELVNHYPKLKKKAHGRAFEKYIERMWTRPTTYEKFLQAYLEFLIPEKPAFRRLNAPPRKKPSSSKKSRRSRRSRRRRRSRRKRSKRRK